MPQRSSLLFERLFAFFKSLNSLMHGMQLVQVTDSELLQACLRLLLDQFLEVILSVFTLLDLCLENFL